MNGHLQDGNQCREVWKYTPGKLDEAQVGALLALAPLAPSWFCWGDKWKNADGQPKAPGNPNDMKSGNAANMETAASLDTALSKLNQAGVAGVGLALKGAASGLLVLDLDHVRDPNTGELHAIGTEAVELSHGGYVEVSPSMTGLRIVAMTDGRQTIKRKINTGIIGPDGNEIGVEVFPSGANVFTRMTGLLIDGASTQVSDGSTLLTWALAQGKQQETTTVGTPAPKKGDAWSKLAHYRGDDEDKAPDEVADAVKLAATRRPTGCIGRVLSSMQAGESDSEAELFAACEAIRKGAGNADDVGTVLLALAGSGARKKLKDRKDYRDQTSEAAARRVLEQIEKGEVKYLSNATWKRLPKLSKTETRPPRALNDVETSGLAEAGQEFVYGKGGRLIDCAANADLALRIDTITSRCFRFNTWTQEVECAAPLTALDVRASTTPGKLRDVDYHLIGAYLLRAWGLRLDGPEVWAAVTMAAHSRTYDPLLDAFSSLPAWDGIDRVNAGGGWLVNYVKADNTGKEEYIRTVGACWLVAATNRALRPGIKMDEVLCLEGLKGGGKSTMFEVLADAVLPGSFTDQLHDITDAKHRIEATESKFIVEISELAGFRRASGQEALKAAISAKSDSARRPYARSPVEVPRRFALVATTNASEYITDPTGALARRFWVVKTLSSEVNQIDMARLREDAVQLWAQALQMARQGAPMYISSETMPEAFKQWVGEREARQEAPAYFEEVCEALTVYARDVAKFPAGMTAGELAKLAGIEPERWVSDTALQRRFTEAMRYVGMVKGKLSRGHTRWTTPPEVLTRVCLM